MSPDHSENDFLDCKLLDPLLEYCHSIPYFKGIMGEVENAKDTLRCECRLFKQLFLNYKWSSIPAGEKLRTTEILAAYLARLSRQLK